MMSGLETYQTYSYVSGAGTVWPFGLLVMALCLVSIKEVTLH